MILSIDPSFTSTGIAYLDDSLNLVSYGCIKSGIRIYDSHTNLHKACRSIIDGILKFISDNSVACDTKIICEYPALATRSGAYLAVLNGYLATTFKDYQSLYFVPPMACNAFIRNKIRTKSYIVNYCKSHNWVPNKRINNDICTAVVLAHILDSIVKKEYSHSYFQING